LRLYSWFNRREASISCIPRILDIRALNQSDVWVNGGFFALRQELFSYINPGEELVREPFQRLVEEHALLGYKYAGFWQCMDTFKDKQGLEELNQGHAPWKVWRDSESLILNGFAKASASA
jgi:glucose-1-phosphate cytidylyltransferase